MSANEKQVGGKHYNKSKSGQQHWDIVDDFNLDYFQGQITKYVMRWRDKGGILDLEKARHVLDKYIEVEQKTAEQARITMMDTGKPISQGYVNQDQQSIPKGGV
jgi:hypothetical protein